MDYVITCLEGLGFNRAYPRFVPTPFEPCCRSHLNRIWLVTSTLRAHKHNAQSTSGETGERGGGAPGSECEETHEHKAGLKCHRLSVGRVNCNLACSIMNMPKKATKFGRET